MFKVLCQEWTTAKESWSFKDVHFKPICETLTLGEDEKKTKTYDNTWSKVVKCEQMLTNIYILHREIILNQPTRYTEGKRCQLGMCNKRPPPESAHSPSVGDY